MQEQTVAMSKRKFRIGDLAQELNIKKYIVRFWEKEFDLKSDRSDGGQRFYTEDDLALFTTIKKLLYEEGFTIAGARKQLGIIDKADGGHEQTLTLTSSATEENLIGACLEPKLQEEHTTFMKKLAGFKQQLIEIKEKID